MRHRAVPKIGEVMPGAPVNIVLKADQGTGREVQGTVRDVLTRGDHHRGIKVRLTDGRIGRVQSRVATPPSGSSSALPNNMDVSRTHMGLQPNQPHGPSSNGLGPRLRYRDVRLDEAQDVPPEQIDLGAYIVPSKRGRGRQAATPKQAADSSNHDQTLENVDDDVAVEVHTAMVTCPVCGAFEGDEFAVAHHVAEHFT